MKQRVLVLEDDAVLNQLIVQYLNNLKYEATGLNLWSKAQRYLEKYEPALILTDARLPDANSIDFIERLSEDYPVVVLTAFGTVRDAVAAIKAGAADYLLKPVSLDSLSLTVRRVLENAALRKDHQFCMRQMQYRDGTEIRAGRTQAMPCIGSKR